MKIKRGVIAALLVVLLTIPAYISILRPGFFSMHDDLQAFRILEMHECFKDLQLPCRWVPNGGYQYGYPLFIYYPPAVYYLGEIFHLMGFQFIDATKIVFILGFALSALTMYLFLKSFLRFWPALIGAMLYTYAPYKAVDVYVRGAMGEFFALVFFPLIFLSIYKLIQTNKLKHIAFFALSLGLLLLTHNLMPILFAPVAILWTLLLLALERKWTVLPKIILGGILGVGLAANFSLPVALERQYVHIDSIISGYFDYRMHFANLEQLFVSTFWGYGSSVWGPYDQLSLTTGQIHWFVGIIAVFLALLNFNKEKKLAVITFALAFIELGVLFMIHQKSSFIWSLFPFLAYVQFPWRLLGISIFLLSILGALAIYFAGIEITKRKRYIGENIFSLTMGLIIIIGLFVLYQPFFKPNSWLNISDKDKFSGESWDKQLTISIFDYLPIYSKLPPINRAPEKPEILEGEAEVTNYKKGSNYQFGDIKVDKEALIRLPLFDFPGMEVKVDNKKVNHWNDDCRYQPFCYGLITFKVPEGEHKINVKLNDTLPRTAGNIISVISIIAIITILVKAKKYEKNSRK